MSMTDQPDSVEIQLRATTAGVTGEWHNAEGPSDVVAAYLRAYADRIDPPRRPTRSIAEQAAALGPGALIEPSPGPASGLRTAIRGIPDHRDTKGPRRMGFGPVNA
jgi:hypothetical protein